MSTEILGTDEITQSDADKFITHNTANRQIEGQRTRVISRANSGPPVSPSNGDVYIVDVASGTWSTATVKDIAHYFGGQWVFYTPIEGAQRFWVNDEDVVITYNGSAWINESVYSMGGPFTTGAITFGDSSGIGLAIDASNLFWDDSNNWFGIGTATPAVPLDVVGDTHTTGLISTGGETAPDVDAGGICINHGANDGNALTFKNSDVAHGVTAYEETDTYASFNKRGGTTGGLDITGIGESTQNTGIRLDAIAGTPNTGDSDDGVLSLVSRKINGTTTQSVANTEVLVSFNNNSSTVSKAVIKGNGDIVTQGGVRTTGLIATGGETAPDVDAGGLCINHGANDGNALTFKNSDVAHPYTSKAETDTYGSINKLSNSSGGLHIKSYAAGAVGSIFVDAFGGPPTNTGLIRIRGGKSSGTGSTPLSDTEELLELINDSNGTIVDVKGNGDIVTQGGVTSAGYTFASGDGLVNGTASIRINIDSDANSSAERFSIGHDQSTGSGNELFTVLESGNVGVGITTPSDIIHAENSGATAAVRVNRSDASIAGYVSVNSGSTTNSLFSTGVKDVTLYTDSLERLRLTSTGSIATGGEAAPDVDAGGICINHGANDGNALTFKNSDVAHGITDQAETDTYGSVSKLSGLSGGLSINGHSELGHAVRFDAVGTSPATSDTGLGVLLFDTSKKSGTGVTSVSNTENMISCRNNGTTKAVIKGNGDIVTQGGIRTTGSIATGGETAPDVDAGGICINHGANDGNALTFKNSDVAHGMTSSAETDTYGSIAKASSTSGGVFFTAYGESTQGMWSRGIASTVDSSDTGLGPMILEGRKKSGTSSIAMAATDNLAVFRTNATVAVIKGNGDIVTQGGIRLGGGTDLLDTYEEGTWTPTIQDASLSDAEGQTYSTQTGTYRRVGNTVFCEGRIVVTSLGTLTSGSASKVSGLPFTIGGESSLQIGYARNLSITSGTTLSGYLVIGATNISLQIWNDVGGTLTSTIADLSATLDIRFSFHYEV